MVELRSEMLLKALQDVIAQMSGAGELFEHVDFENTGLFGHSRGGEAVVRAYQEQKANPIAGLKFKAACSLAPTDQRGASNTHALSMPSGVDSNFLALLNQKRP